MNLDTNLRIKVNLFYSKLAILICLCVLLISSKDIKKWKDPSDLISNDIISYYGYLTATFIYHDLTLKFMEHPPANYRGKFWPGTAPNGGKVMKYTMGLSVLYLPFFTMGHIAAGIKGQIQDGYSPAYCFFLVLGTIIYVVLGLLLLRKILLRFFSDEVTALTILSVFLGTNLLQYSTNDPLMSHAYLFTLYTGLIYLTIKWHENPSWRNSFYVGLLSGLIILVRPSDIVSLFIFFLYEVYSVQSLKQKFILLKNNWPKIMLMVIFIFLVFVPQMIYWKVNTGQWLFYSYFDERFYFTHPHIVDGLFSFRKGWLLYTPLMVLALLGIIFLKKYAKDFYWMLPVFMVVNIWIITSWWSWWYGGGFGCRPMIDSYGLLAIPLAGFYHFFMTRSKAAAVLMVTLAMVLISFQVFQTFQYRYAAIHFDSMTKEAYKKTFLKLRPYDAFYKALKEPDYENAKAGLPEREIVPN